MDNTTLYNLSDIENALIEKTLEEVYEILEERGYNPINQMVGYLISGDPGYISSYKDARIKMSNLDRSRIIETILKDYMKKDA